MPSKNTDTQKTVNRLIEDFHSDDPSKQEAAMEQLLLMHQPFIGNMISKSFPTYKKHFADLMQEGNIGFIKALSAYKPSEGALTTFATFYVRHELAAYVSKQLSNISPHYATTLKRINTAIERLKKEGVTNINMPLLVLETGFNESRIAVALSVNDTSKQNETDWNEEKVFMQTPDSEIRNQSPSDYMEKKELAELVDSAINDYCSPLEKEAIKWKFKLDYSNLTEKQMCQKLKVRKETFRRAIQSGLSSLRNNKQLRRMFDKYEQDESFLKESDILFFIDNKENDEMIQSLLDDEDFAADDDNTV